MPSGLDPIKALLVFLGTVIRSLFVGHDHWTWKEIEKEKEREREKEREKERERER